MQRGTVTVRVKVLVNAEGKYAAYGWDGARDDDPDDTLYDMMSDKDTATAREYWLVAEVQRPHAVEVAAQVEPHAEEEAWP